MINSQNPEESGQHTSPETVSDKLSRYKVKTWNTEAADFQFPEITGEDAYFDANSKRPERGICFSGGGTVSIALIAGYLNALEELGLIPEIGYISGVSGGTWGTAAYMYNPENNPNSLLGSHYANPAEIPASVLETTADGTLAYATCNCPLVAEILEYEGIPALAPQRQVYTMAIGALFLRPFGVESPGFSPDDVLNIKRRKFFTTTEAQAGKIAARNTTLGMKASAFMTLNADRPYYIMNTTLLAKPQEKGSLKNVYPFEFTPLYAGRISSELTDVVDGNQKIGGAFVEPFGFDSTAESDTSSDGFVNASNLYRFELQQPVGTSGSALGKEAQSGDARILDIFFPNFSYWNPTDPNLENGVLKSMKHDFGDGGIIENTGVAPLLARQVKYIAVFLSEMSFYPPVNGGDFHIDTSEFGWKQKVFGYNQIAVLFGGQLIDADAMDPKKQSNGDTENFVNVIWMKDTVNRQVFDNTILDNEFNGELTSTTMLDDVIARLKQVDGGPTSVDLVLDVVDNPLFGIKAYDNVQIKLTIVGSSTNWTDDLTGDVKTAFDESTHGLGGFPNVQVFHQNKGKLIELNAAQANLLGNLAYWNVMQQAKIYHDLLTGNPFN